MTRKEFLEDVVNEVNHLIDNTTQDEKDMLREKTFNPNIYSNCIYGQMTGDCDSDRAKELIPKKYNDFAGMLYQTEGRRSKNFINTEEIHPSFTALELIIMDQHDIGIHLLRRIKKNKKVSYRYVMNLDNKYRE